MQAGHVRAAGIAYETTSGDRDYARPVAAGHPMLAQVSERIPGELIERHWDPVVSVADALIAAPVYLLDAAQVIAVAGLRDIELSWDQLCGHEPLAQAEARCDGGLH
jgi:hypothetical protein